MIIPKIPLAALMAVMIMGCGEKESTAPSDENKATSPTSATAKGEKPRKKAPVARKKVSDEEAARLLLAQNREMMELVGMPQSMVNDKMRPLERDFRKLKNKPSDFVFMARLSLERQGIEPCVSEANELLHVKTEHEKTVMKYSDSRNIVGTEMLQLVFAFRAMSEDEQKDAADKLAKLMN